ncbi:long-chain fatty acid--CoA ligase [Chloroflexi bacterium TSY]|nr:long-chain fatty acid--CoA ligase [Chloroflexi bacterium TSY]
MQGLMMDYALTLDRILEHAKRIYSTKKIYTRLPDGSTHSYTYADLYRRSKLLASALSKRGIRLGNRLGTFGWNNYQHLEQYYGIPGCGAICHTLNIRLFPNQVAYIIEHAEDRLVFVDASLLKLFEPIAAKVNCVEYYVVYGAEEGLKTSLPNVLQYEELLAEGSEEYEWAVTDENTAFGLCYTSGTTGDPKGSLYSHRSMFLHTLGMLQANASAITSNDTILPVVPQFHVMSWGVPYAAAMSGAEVIMPGPFLQPAALAEMVETYGVTVVTGVPTIWNGVYQDVKVNPRDLSTIRALIVGGSAMPRSLIEIYEDELGVDVVHAWGMTEMSPLGTMCRLSNEHKKLSRPEQWDIKAKQGVPIGGVEIRIVDGMNQELPWDGKTMGELQVRGPWIIKQYFKRERTDEHFTQDGWFRTGDVSTISPDEYMQITDRTKDLIKSGGEWISSVELENALMAHDQVLEASVIAVPDEKWSERPLAAIVPVPNGNAPTPDELRAYLEKSFAKWWLPDKIIFIEEVPKTSTGKFDKKVLRQQYAEGKLV